MKLLIIFPACQFWHKLARSCPAFFGAFALRAYLHRCQCVKRAYLEREAAP